MQASPVIRWVRFERAADATGIGQVAMALPKSATGKLQHIGLAEKLGLIWPTKGARLTNPRFF